MFPHVAPIPSRERDEQLRDGTFRVNREMQSLGQIVERIRGKSELQLCTQLRLKRRKREKWLIREDECSLASS